MQAETHKFLNKVYNGESELNLKKTVVEIMSGSYACFFGQPKG